MYETHTLIDLSIRGFVLLFYFSLYKLCAIAGDADLHLVCCVKSRESLLIV